MPLCSHSMVLPAALTASQLQQDYFVNAYELHAHQFMMATGSFLPHLSTKALTEPRSDDGVRQLGPQPDEDHVPLC